MKIFAISDLHLSGVCPKPMNIFGPAWDDYLETIEKNWKRRVKDDDIVLISGDISWAMKINDAVPDLEYISKLKGTKIICKGNHDYWWSSISEVRNRLSGKFFAIQNDAIKVGNVIICGSRGWNIPEGKYKTEQDEKIYKREIIRMELSLKSMTALRKDNDKVVVMTHYPPYNSKMTPNEMTKLFEKYKVDYVVFGHLHSYDKRLKMKFKKNNVRYFLTSCDLVENKLVKIAD